MQFSSLHCQTREGITNTISLLIITLLTDLRQIIQLSALKGSTSINTLGRKENSHDNEIINIKGMKTKERKLNIIIFIY
jgi:hypothetical protein